MFLTPEKRQHIIQTMKYMKQEATMPLIFYTKGVWGAVENQLAQAEVKGAEAMKATKGKE